MISHRFDDTHLELAALLARDFPELRGWQIRDAIAILVHAERSMHHAAELLCSERGNQESFDRVWKRGQKSIHGLLLKLPLSGMEVEYNSDPRGSAIKLHLPSGAYNCAFDCLWHI